MNFDGFKKTNMIFIDFFFTELPLTSHYNIFYDSRQQILTVVVSLFLHINTEKLLFQSAISSVQCTLGLVYTNILKVHSTCYRPRTFKNRTFIRQSAGKPIRRKFWPSTNISTQDTVPEIIDSGPRLIHKKSNQYISNFTTVLVRIFMNKSFRLISG